MEAVIMPSGESELCTEAGSSSKSNDEPLEETTTPRVNGEVNGSSAGEEADSNPESSPTPPPCKRVRNGASEESTTPGRVLRQKAVSDSSSPSTKAAKSPIVVELSSDIDSPVKHINNSVKRKLDSVPEDCDISDSDKMDTGEHENGEVVGDCSDDASESVEQNQSPPAENGGDSEMEVEEIENGNKSSEVLNVSDGEDEVKEVKSTPKKSKDSSGDTDVEEIHDDNDIEEVTTESKDPLDSDAKNGDEDDLKTPTSTPVSSPEKLKMQEARRKSAEAKKQALLNITPRRSSRNLNKNKKYIDGESEPEEPDIEEIVPVDPLAVSAAERVKMTEKDPLSATPEKEPTSVKAKRKNTIIVSDTKALAQIAANSKEGKKEPTLVIIDTNSILSGRGPVPVTSSPSSLPAALPAQGIYPIFNPQTQVVTPPPKPQAPPAPKQKGPVGLTDDMYVVEAPSFIVPYVYEKPPKEPLKEVVEKMAKVLREEEKKEREEKAKEKKRREKEREEREKERKERAEKAKQKKEAEDKEGEKESEDKEKKADGEEEAMEVDEKKKDEDQLSDKDDDEEPKADHDSDYKADSVKDKDSEEEDLEYDSESDSSTSSKPSTKPKSTSYFDSPLGKFFMQIGVNLVQEHVQTDLLRMQKRKLQRGGTSNNPETQLAVHSLLKNLEQSKENNKPYKFEIKKCEFCNFKTESKIVLAHHLEMPHLKNFMYHCNFCPVALRTNHDILFHMEAEHNVNGRIERAPAFHQCPNCPFEDNQKSKMNRHMLSCVKRFRPEKNCEPPVEWEPPAKIPRMSKNMYRPILPGSPQTPQQYLNQRVQGLPQHPLLPKLPATSMMPTLISGSVRGRGRPSVTSRFLPDLKAMPRAIAPSQLRQGSMLYPQQNSRQQVLVPTSYQIAGNQIYQRWSQQVVGGQSSAAAMSAMPRLTLMPHSGSSTVALVPSLSGSSNSITIQSASSKSSAAKLLQQPSISITPLPRQPSGSSSSPSSNFSHPAGKQGQVGGGGKNSFVICEICDGYIKDLEQLRNHMQWIHKVKIHPKMIYNRPPLNCQKCQFRFFTDQGLERHLLGSHGLVTSSMQEASNKGKDGGRCPVCGRVYQWKLLNHVAKDHNMTLKPAHLSYKCTVCTATFGMYKQFENHVYSAHSVVAKRVMDKKSAASASSPGSSRGYSHSAAESLLKPLKINDEITIIPQPAKASSSSSSRGGNHRKTPCQADDSGSENSL